MSEKIKPGADNSTLTHTKESISFPLLDKPDLDKIGFASIISEILQTYGLKVVEKNSEKPWGAYLRLNNGNVPGFIEVFFNGKVNALAEQNLPMTPKILIVEPTKRLSYQKHKRRNEYWRVVSGNPDVTLDEVEIRYAMGDLVKVPQGTRHRISANEERVVVAEIWEHIDPNNPSDEDDITRYDDDFGRK
jgi:mannose-6-phosphate isomerase